MIIFLIILLGLIICDTKIYYPKTRIVLFDSKEIKTWFIKLFKNE